MKKTILTFGLLCVWAGLLSAQTITGLSVDAPKAKVGQTVTATVKLDIGDTANCGIHFHWGDGQTQDIKVNDAKQNPLVLKHSYAKPGNYEVVAEGRKVTSHLKCAGSNPRTTVVVEALPATVPAPAVSASGMDKAAAKPQAVASPCPDGWKLNPKSVNKKTGAFTCTAKAATVLPEKKLSCTGDAGYFENPKKGQLGCRV